jgi:uncharacterized protein YjiS (DUF1127 family)
MVPMPHWRTAITGWLSDIRHWRARKQAMMLLNEFDDHMLRDIGIHRCEIEAILKSGIRD